MKTQKDTQYTKNEDTQKEKHKKRKVQDMQKGKHIKGKA